MVASDGRLARGEASRAAILEAATRVVAGRGIQALTHRAVAAEIGAPHARVVYHFASVDELRRATLVRAGERITGRLALSIGECVDPAQVPQAAGQLAVHMVTDLRDETVTLYALMAQATRDETLRTAAQALTGQISDLVEPLSGSRELASRAAAALLGTVLVAMSEGLDRDPEAIRSLAVDLVAHFDPHTPASQGGTAVQTGDRR